MNPKRIADLSVLLDQNLIAYYWMGFLVADGHFYETAIKLQLAETDRDHIEKFRSFVKYTGKAKACVLNAMNPPVVKDIRNKFGILNRKTYNPCDLIWMQEYPDLFFSFIVGMIDGDGHLSKRKGFVNSIRIKLHKSWLENLRVIEKFLYDYLKINRFEKYKNNSLSKLMNSGFAQLCLSDTSLIYSIAKKIKSFNLPVMDRKWNSIKKVEVRNNILIVERWKTIKTMLDAGISRKNISLVIGIKQKTLNVFIWRKNHENLVD